MDIQERIILDFADKVGKEKWAELPKDLKDVFEKMAKDVGYLHVQRLQRKFDLEHELRQTTAQYLNLEIEGLAELKELFQDSISETIESYVGPLFDIIQGVFQPRS